MRILAIDYGLKKAGVALATSPLAEPYRVIRFRANEELIKEIIKITKEEKIQEIVIGLSEGKMKEETMKFGENLEKESHLPISYQDETLTTQQAQELSIKAGIKRKKRREMEDAYSAALILQAYLDSR